MKRPRLRFTLRSMMVLVAVLALLLSGVPAGMIVGLTMKEEVRARRAVVDGLQSWITYADSWASTLETRLARSNGQAERDPRHDHWQEDLAAWREIATTSRR